LPLLSSLLPRLSPSSLLHLHYLHRAFSPVHPQPKNQEIAKIRGGDVFVVDIAKLTDEEQTLVFGDIPRTIYTLYAEEDDP